MKKLLILLIAILGIILILGLPVDIIKSNLPNWNTTNFPGFLRYPLIVIFNIVLPILFFIKLREKVKPVIIISYFLVINSLYVLLNLWPKGFIKNGNIDYTAFANYAYTLFYITMAILCIHLVFYIFALLKLGQKAAAEG